RRLATVDLHGGPAPADALSARGATPTGEVFSLPPERAPGGAAGPARVIGRLAPPSGLRVPELPPRRPRRPARHSAGPGGVRRLSHRKRLDAEHLHRRRTRAFTAQARGTARRDCLSRLS